MYVPLEAARRVSQSALCDFWSEVDFYPAKWNEETFSIYTGRPINYVGRSFEERSREAKSEINECLRMITTFFDPRADLG